MPISVGHFQKKLNKKQTIEVVFRACDPLKSSETNSKCPRKEATRMGVHPFYNNERNIIKKRGEIE